MVPVGTVDWIWARCPDRGLRTPRLPDVKPPCLTCRVPRDPAFYCPNSPGDPARPVVSVSGGSHPLLDDLVGDAPGDFLQVIEFPGEGPDSHGQGAQLDDEIVEFGLRQKSIHLIPTLPAFLRREAEDLPAAAADQPV